MSSQRPTKPPKDQTSNSNPFAPKSVRRPARHAHLTCDEPFLEYTNDSQDWDEYYRSISLDDDENRDWQPEIPGRVDSETFANERTPTPGRSATQSGTFPSLRALPSEALHAILDLFEEFLGYSFDAARVIHEMGYQRDRLPSSLAPLLVVELSKRLHPARRPEFLRAASTLVRKHGRLGESSSHNGRAIA